MAAIWLSLNKIFCNFHILFILLQYYIIFKLFWVPYWFFCQLCKASSFYSPKNTLDWKLGSCCWILAANLSSHEWEQPENWLIFVCTQQLMTALQCALDPGSQPCCPSETNQDTWGKVVQLGCSPRCIQCGRVRVGPELGHTSFKKWEWSSQVRSPQRKADW